MPKLTDREALVKASIQFTPAQYRELRVIAKKEDRKIAYIVRLAVERFLATEQEQRAA